MTRAPGMDLDWGLRRLRLPTIRRLFRPLMEEAERESWTYQEYLEQLVSEEIAHRAETRIQRATRKARFPYLKTIEQFDFTFQKSVERRTLGSYLGPELVSEGRCAVFLGRTGRGKTHLAIALAYKAIQLGHTARFTSVASLLNDLHTAQREGTLPETIDSYVEPDVLVLDELGYLTYGPDAANHLFPVIDARHLAKRPMLITSNKAPSSWGKVLHDEDLAEAIVDRVLERGELFHMKGRSYRNPGRKEAAKGG